MNTIALVGRWTARITGGLLVLFFLAFLIGEGPPRLSQLTGQERVFGAGMLAMVLGLALAWKWEGLGGALTLAGYVVMALADDRSLSHKSVTAAPFVIPAVIGLVHVLCWWKLRTAGRVTWHPPVWLWAGLGVFILLCANEMFLNPPLMSGRGIPPGTWADGDVVLTIAPDGAVSGTFSGRAQPNRSWFGRVMHWRSDYIIRGGENSAHLSFSGDDLEGGVRIAGRSRRVRLAAKQ